MVTYFTFALALIAPSAAATASPPETTDQTAIPKMVGLPAPTPYPTEALRLHQEGKVVMTLTISAKGSVVACTITTTSGSPTLDRASCEALRKQHFVPARDSAGNKVDGTLTMPMTWRLPAL